MDEDLGVQPTLESKEGDADGDIYEDLPDFQYDLTLDKLKASVVKLEAQNHTLQSRLVEVSEQKKSLDLNYSTLFKTAKLEIQRKDRTISQLREQLKELSRKPYSNIRHRLPSRSSTVTRPLRRAKDLTRGSNVGNKTHRSKSTTPERREGNTRRKENAINVQQVPAEVEKENAPQKYPIDEAPSAPAVACVVVEEPSTEKVAPSLPSIACPTIFSGRMYKRIYGSSPKKNQRQMPRTSEWVQPSYDNKPLRSSKAKRRGRFATRNVESSTRTCRQVTSEDIQAFLGKDDSTESDSSLCSITQIEPSANTITHQISSFVHPKTSVTAHTPEPHTKTVGALPLLPLTTDPPAKVNVAKEMPQRIPLILSNVLEPQLPQHDNPILQSNHILSDVANVGTTDSPTMHINRPCIQSRIEPKTPQPSTRELKVVISSVPSEKTSLSSAATADSPKPHLNPGRLNKPRSQTVAAIRPIQTVVAQDIPGNAGSTSSRPITKTNQPTPPSSSTNKLSEFRLDKVDPDIGGSEKKNRLSKMPGLPGSAKGRTIRRVFAPISNQWSCTLPATSVQSSDRKDCSELSVFQTVSVTSELTVRVEDSKIDGMKRESLAEAMFGSPVKWADDSLDCPTPEGSVNGRKTYSIFGSPLKNVDSNSSELPFSVPPGAYEDSCWTTTQIPEKIQKTPVNNVNQNQCKRSQESICPTETTPNELSNPKNDCVTEENLRPPSPESVIQKPKSIFSPIKDCINSSNVPEALSRSNTTLFFPFSKPHKYNDSILGQFDDTAQFVSAVTSNYKVSSHISPLTTPVKPENTVQSVIVKNKPTSFEEVFNRSIDTVKDNGNVSVGTTVANLKSQSTSNDKESSLSSILPVHNSINSTEPGVTDAPGSRSASPSKFAEPPAITITSPRSKSTHHDDSIVVINRPNLASSSKSFVVKSWFPKGTPAKVVTPRKTPRLITRVSPSAAPKPYASIDFPIFLDQEGRTRSASGSPLKNVNASPTRKRPDLQGKLSPSQRPLRKQVSPIKSSLSPKHSELGRNLPSSVNTLESRNPQLVKRPNFEASGSINEPDLSQNPASSVICNADEKVGSLDMNIGSANPPIETSENPDASALPVLTSQQEKDQSTGIHLPNSTRSLQSWFPIGVPVNIITSQRVASPVLDKSHSSADFLHSTKTGVSDSPITKLCSKEGTVLQPNNTIPLPIHSTPILEDAANMTVNNANSADQPSVGSHQGIKGTKPSHADKETAMSSACAGTTNGDSAKTTVPVPISSHVGNAQTSDITTCAQSSTKVSPNIGNKSIRKKTCSIPSKSTDCAEKCISTTPETKTRVDGRSLGKPLQCESMIQRVIPPTPVLKSVAALISKSIKSTSSNPRPSIKPQSTQQSNFKRSSALKPDAQKGSGTNRMNSIRATFYQTTGTPTAGCAPDRSNSRRVASPEEKNFSNNSNHARSHQKGDLTSDNSHDVVQFGKRVKRDALETLKSVTEKQSNNAPPWEGKHRGSVYSNKPAETLNSNSNVPWKLREIDCSTRPVSFLERFNRLKDGHALHTPVDEDSRSRTYSQTGNASTRGIRKTILLDTPLKMETPTKKRKRSGDFVGSPRYNNETSASTSKDQKDTRNETSSVRRENIENTSPTKTSSGTLRDDSRGKMRKTSSRKIFVRNDQPVKYDKQRIDSEPRMGGSGFKKPPEPEKSHREYRRKPSRIDFRARYIRRSRSISSEVSTMRLRALKRDPFPNQFRSKFHHREERSSHRRNKCPKRYCESSASCSDDEKEHKSQSKAKKRLVECSYKKKETVFPSASPAALSVKPVTGLRGVPLVSSRKEGKVVNNPCKISTDEQDVTLTPKSHQVAAVQTSSSSIPPWARSKKKVRVVSVQKLETPLPPSRDQP